MTRLKSLSIIMAALLAAQAGLNPKVGAMETNVAVEEALSINLQELKQSIKNDDVVAVSQLLESVDVNSFKFEGGETVLQFALSENALRVAGVIADKVDDEAKSEALLSAIVEGQKDIVDLMIDKVDDEAKSKALRGAVVKGKKDIVELMVDKVDNKAKGEALESAVYLDKKDIVELMIDKVDDVVKIEALKSAISTDKNDIVELLIDRVDNAVKRVAFKFAFLLDKTVIIALMIDKVDDEAKIEALESAVRNGQKDIVELINKSGVLTISDCFRILLYQEGDENFNQYTNLDDPEIQCDEVIKAQIKAVVDGLIENVDNKTPPKNLSEEEIQKGIERHEFSKHYKLSRNLRITKAIYLWIVRNVEYTETLKSLESEEHTKFLNRCLESVFVNKKGVCLGKSLLFKLMARMAGIPCESLGGGNHAFNAVYIDKFNGEKGWTIIDPTWGRFDIASKDYTEDLDSLFDEVLEELKSLYSEESGFKFNEEQEKEYFSKLKSLVKKKKQEYDKSKETQTITAEDIQTINGEYEVKDGCVVVKHILIVEKDGNCKIRINFDFQKNKLLREPTKLTRQENFPAFYGEETKLSEDNSTMVEGGKNSHKIEHIGNIYFERTEKGDLKIHNSFSKINLRITEGMVAPGKKIIVGNGIKKLKLCGNVEIDISGASDLEEIDVSGSTQYDITRGGILYEKSSKKVIGVISKEFSLHVINGNSVEISPKGGVRKLVITQEISDLNKKIVVSPTVKSLEIHGDAEIDISKAYDLEEIDVSNSTRYGITSWGMLYEKASGKKVGIISKEFSLRVINGNSVEISPKGEVRKLVITRELSELNKKIVIGYGVKSLEIHGDVEIDISHAHMLEEIDVSNSTRYGITSGGILYEKASGKKVGIILKEFCVETIDDNSIKIFHPATDETKKLVITQEMSELNKKIVVVSYAIKSLEIHGDAEVDISNARNLEEIDVSDSTRYGFTNGILYEKTSGKIIGVILKEFYFSLDDNSIKISSGKNIEKLVLMKERSNSNQKIDFGSEVKILDLDGNEAIDVGNILNLEELYVNSLTQYGAVNGGILYEKTSGKKVGLILKEVSAENTDDNSIRIFLTSFKEEKKLVVIQEMSGLNKKIVVGGGFKNLEVCGDAEIDISRTSDLEEIDISNSTRYDFMDGILYEKSSRKIIGANPKDFYFRLDDNSISMSSKGKVEKLVVTQEMSSLSHKIGVVCKIKSLEVHGDAEVDISYAYNLEELDISDSTRYDIKDGKLYDITDPNNFKEVQHSYKGFKVITNQGEVYVGSTGY